MEKVKRMTEQKKEQTLISKRDIIADYLSIRTILIPLNGKTPVEKEWTKTQFSEETTPEDFEGNYGVLLEEDDLIIDYDPRNDKTEGKSAYQNLVNYVGEAFDTYTVRTGGGGLHIYLKKPKGFHVVNSLPLDEYPQFSGIEFKTFGRQVVGPGSIHPDTKELYRVEWKRPSDERMEAPQKLLDLIKKEINIKGLDLQGVGLGSFTDDNQSVGRYVEFLNNSTPAIEGQGGDLKTYQMACRGRDFNLSPQKTFEVLLKYYNPRCIPSWEEKDLWVKVKSAYTNNKDIQGKWNPQADFDIPDLLDLPENIRNAPIFERDKQGMPKKMLRNVISFMMLEDNPLYDLLRFNLFTNSIEFKDRAPWHATDGKCWSDEDAIQFKVWLSNQSFEISVNIIHEAALIVASRNSYHPIKNYLEALEWDGTPRIHNWLSEYCKTQENDYTKAIGQKVLLAALSRIYNPGTKFDYVLVLEGPQGIGKSTFVSILGKYWYGDILIDPYSKDTVDALRGKWIIEISEMECAKREVTALKRFISCVSDRVRPAYARTTQDFPRQCVFIGTINPENGRGYLKDPTGNRRYWPVYLEAIDFVRLRSDIDQIWAEAVQVYKKGDFKLYLDTKELQDFARKQADERFETDPIEEVIGNYLVDTNRERITNQEIMTDCLMMSVSRLDKFFAGRIACAMNRLGYAYKLARYQGRTQRCYVKISSLEQEIASQEDTTKQSSRKSEIIMDI